jgi:hypothetical protein
MLINLFFALMQAFALAKTHNILQQFTGAILISFYVLMCCAFMNVFSTYLYKEGVTVNADGSPIPLVAGENTADVEKHTLFFAVEIAAEVGIVAVTWMLLKTHYQTTVGTHMPWYKMVLLIFFGTWLFGYFLVLVLGVTTWKNPTDKWFDNPETFVQEIVNILIVKTKASTFFLIAMFGYRFCYPKHYSIVVNVREDTSRGLTAIDPKKLFAFSARLLGVLLLGTYAFSNPDQKGKFQAVAVFNGFSEEPFSFYFVPAWLAIMFMTFIATSLSVVGMALSKGTSHRLTKASALLGLLFNFSLLFPFWIVLPEFRASGGYEILPFLILFPLWVLVTYGLHVRSIVYNVIWTIAIGCTFIEDLSVNVICNCVVIGLLAFVDILMPHGRPEFQLITYHLYQK